MVILTQKEREKIIEYCGCYNVKNYGKKILTERLRGLVYDFRNNVIDIPMAYDQGFGRIGYGHVGPDKSVLIKRMKDIVKVLEKIDDEY